MRNYKLYAVLQNVAKGTYVICAKVGALLPKNLKIKSSKIRGVVSNGMLCSEKELGFSDNGEGIIVLESSVVTKWGPKSSDVLKNDKILISNQHLTERTAFQFVASLEI